MLIDSKYIKALSLFVANNKDTRYYLRYINFEAHPDKTIMTACDGGVLMSIVVYEQHAEFDNFSLLPSAFNKGKEFFVCRNDDKFINIAGDGIESKAPICESKFVDFRRAIPKELAENAKFEFFDPELLIKFKKASKILGGSKYVMAYPNGFVDIGLHGVVGVCMPMRSTVIEKYAAYPDVKPPAWMGSVAPEIPKPTKAA